MKKTLAIAIDIGASYLRAAIVSKQGKIIKRLITKTPQKGKSGKVVTDTLIVLLNVLLENFNKGKVVGIGISSIGPLDYKTGTIVNSPNVSFKKISIKNPLEKYFSLPVALYNDCTSAVWGEKTFGAGKKSKNLVYITISTGIGGGAIADNRLLIGHSYNATEIGHFNVDTKYNLSCGCGKGHGHWEAYCSGTNIPRFFKHWLKLKGIRKKYSYVTAKEILNADIKTDNNIKNFLNEIGQLNGKGVSNVIVAYDPEIIILGGAVVLNNQKIILQGIKKNIDRFLKPPKIIITRLGEDVALFGAAALIFSPPK
jgi:glucokinase